MTYSPRYDITTYGTTTYDETQSAAGDPRAPQFPEPCMTANSRETGTRPGPGPSPGPGPVTRAPATLGQARDVLAAGGAVVLPNPAPLTHVVTATGATAVNRAKGRPADQPVALWAHDPETLRVLEPVWDLGPDGRALARRLLSEEHLTVLLPLRAGARRPHWTGPAAKDGWMLLFGARWQPVRPLLEDHPVLYVSSANRTGRPPAATTDEALTMFPAAVPVLAAPHPEDAREDARPSVPRRATTTVRLHPDGRPTLHRPGAQDAPYARPEEYLDRLRTGA
ncbi:Sua5/YciO/YrdC/YwlC family protein [Streptomyces ziwulingensis]|uniref:YrdC-like domain-containing protein n=1 Tax=Streptomyces ziwulingensis TaxID=1045501 RepID=A0ABP9BY58_9ACTN